jgi:hypothetical protein
MWKDPIVEEVRSIREQLAEACGFDIRRIVADAEGKQRTSGHRLVSFAKGKRPPQVKGKAAPS